ncbi:hypothetical protein HMPREF0973_00017 [Prevotella veroralis F0319]|uniref:Uncharacterized protein n=1 Tax=Prevotella veroralis F0319 TaxID=649761 RepID=C9MKA0_9BACT|nr:hypothetical protein HMPREF0973_00017 [Prevotella veroralis F0319]
MQTTPFTPLSIRRGDGGEAAFPTEQTARLLVNQSTRPLIPTTL